MSPLQQFSTSGALRRCSPLVAHYGKVKKGSSFVKVFEPIVTEGNAAPAIVQAADDSASLSTTAAGVSWEGATGSFPAKARMVAIM